jgi:hypothetical protein
LKPARYKNWLTAQQASVDLNTTSAEVCRLISIGRLSGVKFKQEGRSGKAQWLVDPKSVTKEKKRNPKRWAKPKKTSNPPE